MTVASIALQVLLGLAFLAAGITKVVSSKDALRTRMTWVDSFPAWSVKGIGVMEALGALGLLLPLVTPLGAVITLLAAIGLAIAMVLAIIVHILLKEAGQSAPAAVLLLLLLALIALLVTNS